MPEYLSPGVYVEEVSFRAKSIEGVPTSTTGIVGTTRFGPVHYANGPTTTEPRLVTSFTEFERIYGGLDPLEGGLDANYTAHAARAFFMNGGKRLYVSRVFSPDDGTGVASLAISLGGGATATWRARWPGAYGNVWVETRVRRSKNIAFMDDPPPAGFGKVQVKRARQGSIVEIHPATDPVPKDTDPPDALKLAMVDLLTTGEQRFQQAGGGTATPGATDVIYLLELEVRVVVDADRTDFYGGLGAAEAQTRYIGKILQADNPEDENAVVWLDFTPGALPDSAIGLVTGLVGTTDHRLTGGTDGTIPGPFGATDTYEGMEADPDVITKKATGLFALDEIDDVAIVLAPDAAAMPNADTSFSIHGLLVKHCEDLKYRFGIVDGPRNATMNQIRTYRGRFDTKYAALYHPWIEILDPLQRPAQGAPPDRLTLPPSAFVAGIYARSDVERGVHKAPANEVVRGLTRFEVNINKGRNDVLNPEGINALRFFEGRGNRVWGARTMSSDPEWRYVNVRRLFIYLEHSIDKATQWAVFEPNNERLWANVRRQVEDFLLVLWKDGALLGDKPEKAFFVRADRTTMTQNDLDAGRLIVLVGVAPTYPAEFVIFRVGQWTADAKFN